MMKPASEGTDIAGGALARGECGAASATYAPRVFRIDNTHNVVARDL